MVPGPRNLMSGKSNVQKRPSRIEFVVTACQKFEENWRNMMSAHQITKFEPNKFYVMTPPGEQWSDYDGPFDTDEEALNFLRQFINENFNHSPEMLMMVVIHFDGKHTNLVKRDGVPLDGQYLTLWE